MLLGSAHTTMQIYHRLAKATLIITAVLSLSFAPRAAVGAEEVSFKVKNTTKDTIKKLLASEDGMTFGFFDIGKGIKPGEEVTLVWDKSSHNQNCKQFFKAVYADGEESEAVKFDFCEDDLELEF